MKNKIIVIALVCTSLLVLPHYLLGFHLWHVADALRVAAGMGAKLNCSAKYISGFSEAQAKQDLLSYSPANDLLDIQYDDTTKTVTANMLGLVEHSATYRNNLGCTLNIGDTQHLNQLDQRITAAPASNQPWPVGSDVATIQSEKQAALQTLLEKDNAAGLQTRALLWLHQGEIVAEAYAEGITQQTPLLGWSMGKSVTALLIGHMEQLGMISLDQRELFKQWSKDERNTISLQQMLRMSSGLAFDEIYAPGSHATEMLFLSHSASDIALRYPLIHAPGSYFSYSSGTTNMLNRWMHNRLGNSTQKSYDFFQKFKHKLHLENTFFEPDASGVFVGSSYIYASARDWARMAQLILNNGHWRGESVLSEAFVQAMQAQNESENNSGYGYQVWLNDKGNSLMHSKIPKDAFFMLGNREQIVMIIPSLNMAVIRLGWSASPYPLNENFSTLVNWNS